uniref:Uncharacterized protein n=1 Tax=Zea mays TaxID=4577 RepID=A0A804NZ45_MAIZE
MPSRKYVLEIATFRYALQRRPPPTAAELLFPVTTARFLANERRHHVVQRHALLVEHLPELLLADHQLHPDGGGAASSRQQGLAEGGGSGRRDLRQAARARRGRRWRVEDAAVVHDAHDLDLLPVVCLLNHQAVSHVDIYIYMAIARCGRTKI